MKFLKREEHFRNRHFLCIPRNVPSVAWISGQSLPMICRNMTNVSKRSKFRKRWWKLSNFLPTFVKALLILFGEKETWAVQRDAKPSRDAKSCRSGPVLQIVSFLAIAAVDPAENELLQDERQSVLRFISSTLSVIPYSLHLGWRRRSWCGHPWCCKTENIWACASARQRLLLLSSMLVFSVRLRHDRERSMRLADVSETCLPASITT